MRPTLVVTRLVKRGGRVAKRVGRLAKGAARVVVKR